jgi:S1-C subfamily serine protease
MRIFLLTVCFGLCLSSLAGAAIGQSGRAPSGHGTSVKPAAADQATSEFPSEKVARIAGDSVVSIDINSVAYGSISTGALPTTGGLIVQTTTARTGTLATKHVTGFILDNKGHIVTDSTDIEGATMLNVRLSDGTELPAKVIGTDGFYGVGVIQVDPPKGKKLHPAAILQAKYDPFKDIYPYDQGDSVVSIGYSGGFGGTVTYGIISAIRNFRNRNRVLLPSVIQSDVVINTGNEGSPLFNEKGEVIAMHERRGGGGSMQNTTFFTPIDIIKRAAGEIIQDYDAGREVEVWHPWLGIKPFSGSFSLNGRLRQVTDDLKMFYNIPYQYWDVGVWLDEVYPESPAREFGLIDKDILLEVEVLDKNEKVKYKKQLLKSIQDLELMVTTADEGDIFVFSVLRDFKLFNVEVVIGQHPGEFSNATRDDEIGTVSSADYF